MVIVKDHTRNTLNLVIATRNIIVYMRLKLKDIPIPYMIHSHKNTGEFIYSDLMKANLNVSKL